MMPCDIPNDLKYTNVTSSRLDKFHHINFRLNSVVNFKLECDWLSYLILSTGARCVRKPPQKTKYIILQGANSLASIFLSRRVKLIVTSERLNIFKTCFHQSKVK